jgi:hypothetical protein
MRRFSPGKRPPRRGAALGSVDRTLLTGEADVGALVIRQRQQTPRPAPKSSTPQHRRLDPLHNRHAAASEASCLGDAVTLRT